MSSTETDPKFEALIEYLHRVRGFDFRGYKRSSLMRRVSKRLMVLQIAGVDDYLDYLEVHPDEFTSLFNAILINVTSFFRDPSAWDYLSQEAIPRILQIKKGSDPIRAWSAGCASGQEAYSLAMLLVEALGVEAFHQRVKIYATDVDEEGLAQAQQATYNAKEMESAPPELVARYFETTGGRYVFRPDLRRAIIFGRHDLIQDAPISRLDLLLCRNTLMYFNAETQAHILARFHLALNSHGSLFLGKAEMMLTHANLFTPLDLKHRIFVKVPQVTIRDRLWALAQSGDAEAASQLSAPISR